MIGFTGDMGVTAPTTASLAHPELHVAKKAAAIKDAKNNFLIPIFIYSSSNFENF